MNASPPWSGWLAAGLLLLLSSTAPAQAQPRLQPANLRQQAAALRTEARTARHQAQAFAHTTGFPAHTVVTEEAIFELQRVEADRPIYYVTQNVAAQTTSTDKVWPGGGSGLDLTGAGITVGLWDGRGVYTAHQEFEGRVQQADGQQPVAHHATRVAGVLAAAGLDPKARGMAFGAQVDAYNWTFDTSEMAAAAANGLPISNHSYGEAAGWVYNLRGDDRWVWLGDARMSPSEDYRFGFYSYTAQQWDALAHNAPHYLIVKAAGNDRGDAPPNDRPFWWRDPSTGQWMLVSDALPAPDGTADGYDTLTGAGVAKNVLTVGAVRSIPGGYTQPQDVRMTPFSSWGPADDGRIKPDIVAGGTDVYGPQASAPAAYGRSSGTSLAAPTAAGSIALLLEHQRHLHGHVPLRAATLKTLVIHTADEAGRYPGPDYQHGWGLLNTQRAARVMSQAATGEAARLYEHALVDQEVLEFDVWSNGHIPLQATIGWTDPAAAASSPALNNRTPKLINDLDLRLYGPDGKVHAPWVLDPAHPAAPAATGDNRRDNVEQVRIAAPAPGWYTVRIVHKGSLMDGQQLVSLVLTGIAPSPDAVTVHIRVFLQGAFIEDGMSTELNAAGLLPLIQPYRAERFAGTPLHYEGTEAVSPGFFAAHPDLVDWVLVELRTDPATPVARRAALLRRDGTVVDLDGLSPVVFDAAIPGTYFIALQHRNHLPVMSTQVVPLDAGSPLYDFTSGPEQAYGPAPMTKLETDAYGAWAGDVNADGALKYGGPQNDRLPILNRIDNVPSGMFRGYCEEDVNMDGKVRYAGPQNDRLIILNNVDNQLTGIRWQPLPD